METKRSCDELLKEYRNNRKVISTHRIQFYLGENDDRDVYNISAPFQWNGETLIAGRVEARDSEVSETVFFEEKDGRWVKKEGYPVLKLQDPFITKHGGEILVGGVEIYDDPECSGHLAYRTVFYKGKTIRELERFAQGPERMKDIRLLSISDHDIWVFTRPQGMIGGRGKIAFTHISDLSQLNVENIRKAEVLEDQFYEEEWGGSNELHLLRNGKVGVLSHIAKFDEQGNRHYYSSCFCFDLNTGEYSPMKIIAAREDFEKGDAKRPDLIDVIFSGGMIRKPGGLAELYCGVSDAQGHVIEIPDPFSEYEETLFQ
ncbi:hypothetical protein HNQ56_002569 [Anaerotaenia torta]|uniref:DUF1861 family protein n=1 Tax=Anaerotaenia torta TaxID=433293 RepID=UPI003D24C85A